MLTSIPYIAFTEFFLWNSGLKFKISSGFMLKNL